jgi:hypothetical protein
MKGSENNGKRYKKGRKIRGPPPPIHIPLSVGEEQGRRRGK